jgi:DNA-binding IclR family transcriptional regulator
MAEPKRKRSGLSPDRQLAKAVETSKAPAISRAIAVLRLLGKSDIPLGVQAIARELGIGPSTCLYVLRTLIDGELVSFDPNTKRYVLEAGVLTLARHWLKRNRFTDVAQPVIDQIGRDFDVTVAGMHVVGLQHIIVVAASQPGSNVQISIQIGSRFPALISVTGRCIAAFGNYPEAELESHFRALRWDMPPTFDEWRAQVRQTRTQGFAVDDGNYISGVTLIGAPVWTRDQLSHTLVAACLGSTLKRKGFPKLQKALLSGAQALTERLSGGPARGNAALTAQATTSLYISQIGSDGVSHEDRVHRPREHGPSHEHTPDASGSFPGGARRQSKGRRIAAETRRGMGVRKS